MCRQRAIATVALRRGALVALTVALAVTVSGCGGTRTVTETVTERAAGPSTEPVDLGAPKVRVEFGHIRSLTPTAGRYEMRFDPALILAGETANEAAAEDGAVEPGEPVPNDNYVVDESPRTYTYRVADDVKVTVLRAGERTRRVRAARHRRLDHDRHRYGSLRLPAVQAVALCLPEVQVR